MDWSSVLPAVLTIAGGAASVTLAAVLNHRHERRFADQARLIGWLESLSEILTKVVAYCDAAAEASYRGKAAPNDAPPMHLAGIMERFDQSMFRAEHLVTVINDDKLTERFTELTGTMEQFAPPDIDGIAAWRPESWDEDMLRHRKNIRDEIGRLLRDARGQRRSLMKRIFGRNRYR